MGKYGSLYPPVLPSKEEVQQLPVMDVAPVNVVSGRMGKNSVFPLILLVKVMPSVPL
jgi:hypothetical protein